ncbi:GNAT family N-acetyltransferase [Streptomyces sp. RGM 3693]|uniref:GNAT family N-acetyltransferase n=1 Tax=Streptomyces sp. RGM 3693 TaxID=3413284 RepID=UPI003D2A9AA8
MDLNVVPFEDGMVEAAGELLAAVHTPAAGTPAAAVDPADSDTARSHLDAWRAAGPAVAALAGDGTLAGFMVANVAPSPGDPVGRIPLSHHATAPGGARATYRHLYRALSRRLVDIGCFEHRIKVAADHSDTLAVFVQLGFGIEQIRGLRPLTPPNGTAGKARVRQATTEDLPELLALVLEVQKFHAEAPIHLPALIDLHAMRDNLQASVTDARRLALVAEVDGRPAGLMVVEPHSGIPGAVAIGIAAVTAAVRGGGLGTALLSGVLEWATRQGHRACAVSWSSVNLVSDAFWRGHGFTPARYTLVRRLDPRIAWAHSRLDYQDFLPGDGPHGQ